MASLLLDQSHRVHELFLPLAQTRAEHDTVLKLLVMLAEVLETDFLGKNRVEQALISRELPLVPFVLWLFIARLHLDHQIPPLGRFNQEVVKILGNAIILRRIAVLEEEVVMR